MLPPLKPLPMKERVSLVFLRYGELDVIDGAFVLVDGNGVRKQMTDIQQKHPHLLAEFIARARAYGQQLFPELTPDGAPENRLGHER